MTNKFIGNPHKKEIEIYRSLDDDDGSKEGQLQSILMKGASNHLRREDKKYYKEIMLELFYKLLLPPSKIHKDYKPEDDLPALNELFKDEIVEKGLNLKNIYEKHTDKFYQRLLDSFLDWQIESAFIRQAWEKL